MLKVFSSICLLSLIIFVSLKSNSDSKPNNFIATINIESNLIYEGEEIYINIKIKNNSNRKDSIKDLDDYNVLKSLTILGSKGLHCNTFEMMVDRSSDYYSIFKPLEEKVFRFPLTLACTFAGFTDEFGYYPKDNYNVNFQFTNENEKLKSMPISFSVLENYGKAAIVFQQIRKLDTLANLNNKKISIPLIDKMEEIINNNIDLKLVEGLIFYSMLHKEFLHYKLETIIDDGISYLNRNHNLRINDKIINNIFSVIKYHFSSLKEEKYNEFRNKLFDSLNYDQLYRNVIISKVDSLKSLERP